MRADNVAIKENSRPDHHGTCVKLCFLAENMSQEIRGLKQNESQDNYQRDNDLLQQALQAKFWAVCTNP